ncbi:hypothetical protein [Planctomycetes bacterium Poly30]|uniref:hypothetical protein n=1 Tax=Saltatorellus ferox TaxID=2528018 RepID=UPI0011A7DD87
MTARTPGDTHIAFDVPVDLSQGNPDPHLVMGDSTSTFIEVSCGGEVLEGVWFTYFLAKSKVYHIAHRSDQSGRTRAFHLHPDSQVEVKVDDDSLWAPVRQVVLQPGRNGFKVWKMGEIQVPNPAVLASLYSVEFGVDLASWMAEGRVKSSPMIGGGASIRVPAGQYLRQLSEEASVDLEVTPGAAVDLR